MGDLAAVRARGVAFWDLAAPGWIRHADRQDAFGRPLGAGALAALDVRPGERVLDVGCAAGGTSAELAAAVGPAGEVLGLDLAPSMVAAAARRFPPDPHPRLRFLAGDVETLGTVPGAPFDAAHARMVVMLLADPVAGCATVHRSLRPGGRLAATVFRDGASTPWVYAVLLGAAPHLGPVAPLPIGDEPGPFAFADPDRLRAVLEAAGFEEVSVRSADVVLTPPDEPDTVTEWLIEVGPAGGAYRAATARQQAAARAGTARLLDRFRRPRTGYRLPAGIWVATARRS